MPILCDTVCIWALYFRDSVYRAHVLELRRRHGLLVPKACLLEAAYPIFKAKGLDELRRYATFLRYLPLAPGIKILELGYEDLVKALELARECLEVFVDERSNLCLFDALVASTWLRTRLALATSDLKLARLIDYYPGLKGKLILLEKRPPSVPR